MVFTKEPNYSVITANDYFVQQNLTLTESNKHKQYLVKE